MARTFIEAGSASHSTRLPPREHAPSPAEIVAWLKCPVAYDERPARVECRETHISWVFLAGRYVYKLKKPVRFDFLDFSTPALRRQACEDEVRLNQRLAKGVYLAVVPVAIGPGGELALGGKGRAGDSQVVDWLVKMRRLPAERMLDELLRSGQLAAAEIDGLAAFLARFYQCASPLTLSAWGYRQVIEGHIRVNRRELLDPVHGLSAAVVKRVHAAQLRFLQLETAQIEARVCDGRIIDGHGDLRPEHICLKSEPIIFDCIEFNDDFRRIDVVDELAFLAMECDSLGAEPVGRRILEVYCRTNRDRFSDGLVNFYKMYRACVRAKVAVLSAAQANAAAQATSLHRASSLDLAHQYLKLADAYATKMGPPAAIVVTGLMGSGKSTLAKALAELLGAELVQTDQVRRELLGPSSTPSGFNQGPYRPEVRDRVYDEVLRRTEEVLGKGLSVVLDGTFLAARHRQRAIAEARRRCAVPLVVRCSCAADVALERIARRAAAGTSQSEARPELYRLQQTEYEADPPGEATLEIETTTTLRVQEAVVLDRLKQLLDAAGSMT
ncbi:MAG TPA: AAA family ATPase [Pirellulales bacterium]|nr:AAA family ATPase [Pirellulales bacterium]